MLQSPNPRLQQKSPDFKTRFGVVPNSVPPKLTRLQARRAQRKRYTWGAVLFSLLLGTTAAAAFLVGQDVDNITAFFKSSKLPVASAPPPKVAEAPPAAAAPPAVIAESAPAAAPAAVAPVAEPAPVVPAPAPEMAAAEPVAVLPPPVEAPPSIEPEPGAEAPAAAEPPVVVLQSETVDAATSTAAADPAVEEEVPAVEPEAAAPVPEEPEAQVTMAVPQVIPAQPAVVAPAAPVVMKPGGAVPLISGQVFRDCDNCPDVVVVVPPQRDTSSGAVQVTRADGTADLAPFAIGRFEITFDDWARCMAGGGCSDVPGDEGWGRNTRPVINVSFEMASTQYLPWLSRVTGATYRLPTSAEWEFAEAGAGATPANGVTLIDAQSVCQAGNYSNAGGGDAGEATCADGFPSTAPAGSLNGNGLGLHDMRGNVWEWVSDCWSAGFKYKPKASEQDCSKRLLRGGSWSSRALLSAVPARGFEQAKRATKTIGFRVARSLP